MSRGEVEFPARAPGDVTFANCIFLFGIRRKHRMGLAPSGRHRHLRCQRNAH